MTTIIIYSACYLKVPYHLSEDACPSQAQYVINFTEGPSQEDVDSHWKSNGRAETEVPLGACTLAHSL